MKSKFAENIILLIISFIVMGGGIHELITGKAFEGANGSGPHYEGWTARLMGLYMTALGGLGMRGYLRTIMHGEEDEEKD